MGRSDVGRRPENALVIVFKGALNEACRSMITAGWHQKNKRPLGPSAAAVKSHRFIFCFYLVLPSFFFFATQARAKKKYHATFPRDQKTILIISNSIKFDRETITR